MRLIAPKQLQMGYKLARWELILLRSPRWARVHEVVVLANLLRMPGAWLGLQLARATTNFAEPANQQLRLLLLRYRQRCMGTAAGYGPWPRYDQSKVLVPKTARCPCLHSVSPPWMA